VLINNIVLNNAYKKEKDSNVKERILLVKRIKIDKQEAASVAENELNRSRWWAYKWLHRIDKDGLEGLKNKKRSGRPPDVPEDVMVEIQKELSDSNWMGFQTGNGSDIHKVRNRIS
jgi:putative transposase